MGVSTRIEDDGRIVLAVSGDLDVSTADDVRDIGLGVLACEHCRLVVVDLGAADFVDSAGLGALIALRNAALEQGRELRVGARTPQFDRLVAISGLTSVFGTEAAPEAD